MTQSKLKTTALKCEKYQPTKSKSQERVNRKSDGKKVTQKNLIYFNELKYFIF